jgi:hypothetical protein
VRFRAALLCAILAACSSPSLPSAVQLATPIATPAPLASATPITVTQSEYGRLTALTAPGTGCRVAVHVGTPRFGDVPPATIDATADASGIVSVTYRAPTIPKQSGRYEVTCGNGSVSAPFAVTGYPIPAVRFTARLQIAGLTDQIDGVAARADPSLVPARDRDVDALNRTLVTEWTAATRGLSTLELVSAAPADIVINVVPARAAPQLVRSTSDGSMAIFLFPMAEDGSVFSADNFVAVTLHELGHIWCCTGPDASADGHWALPVVDPLLQGIDRFGLMNHPVSCIVFAAGIESCPNRFSERELRTMGFSVIPPPPRSPCLDSKNALLAQLTTLKAQLATAKATVSATDATLASLLQQIKAIEARYPGGIPADQYPQYKALVDQYNATLAVERGQVSTYNALVDQSNGIIDQVNRLIC